jgi:hypothetical protein
MPDPYTSADHTLTKKRDGIFDKLYQRRNTVRLIGIRLWIGSRNVPNQYV